MSNTRENTIELIRLFNDEIAQFRSRMWNAMMTYLIFCFVTQGAALRYREFVDWPVVVIFVPFMTAIGVWSWQIVSTSRVRANHGKSMRQRLIDNLDLATSVQFSEDVHGQVKDGEPGQLSKSYRRIILVVCGMTILALLTAAALPRA